MVMCEACKQEEYLSDPNTDLSACEPPALRHVCKKWLKTEKQVRAALKVAEARFADPKESEWNKEPHIREEIKGLRMRLLEFHVGEEGMKELEAEIFKIICSACKVDTHHAAYLADLNSHEKVRPIMELFGKLHARAD